MSYSKYHNPWHDYPTTDTPVTGAALDHIEQGIADALPKDGTDPMTGTLVLASGGVQFSDATTLTTAPAAGVTMGLLIALGG